MLPLFEANFHSRLRLPHRQPIPAGLKSGTQIFITGTPTGKRFEVNIKSLKRSVLLHVNPRFDQQSLVLNDANKGSWNQEQRYSLPFQLNGRFVMQITVTDRGFQISINNAFICEFTHRAAMHFGKIIEVNGDINLESVQVQNQPGNLIDAAQTAVQFTRALASSVNNSRVLSNILNPPIVTVASPPPPPVVLVPAATSVYPGAIVMPITPCKMYPGSRITLRGQIPFGAQQFQVNLIQGFTEENDIIFHFNPRFYQGQIVKNHRKNGAWSREENQSFPMHVPLSPGSYIELCITCDHQKYMVLINNIPVSEFTHKLPPSWVTAIQYKGDIQVTSISEM